MLHRFLILSVMLGFFSCKSPADLSTVPEVDLERYVGQWYEIARLPNSFEKDLKCITANYSFQENGKIQVVNRGFSEKKNSYRSATATAWVPNPEFPGRLKVRFFWPFAGDYYIIELDEDYSYALVGEPKRKYLWVLSRTKVLDDAVYSELMEIAKSKGFPVQSMIRVEHDCE